MTFEEDIKATKHRFHIKGRPLRQVLGYCKGYRFEEGCLYTILDKIVTEIEKIKADMQHDKELHRNRNAKK